MQSTFLAIWRENCASACKIVRFAQGTGDFIRCRGTSDFEIRVSVGGLSRIPCLTNSSCVCVLVKYSKSVHCVHTET
jgi:hypothetical protein